MTKNAKVRLRGRSAETGRFTTLKEARARGSTHVVERVRMPPRGGRQGK